MSGRRYHVVIPYVEPTYQARGNPRLEPYRATFEVDARSQEEAISLALGLFEGDALDSGVGWIREPVETEMFEQQG